MFIIFLRFYYRIIGFLTVGRFYKFFVSQFKFFAPISQTSKNETPISLKQWLKFRVFYPNVKGIYWPKHKTSTFVGNWRNVYVGIDSSPTISPGCYVQAVGEILIGDYAQIAPNVGIISANHFMLDIRRHVKGRVVIGQYCRIGMGSIIHSNVTLGDFVTVAAGSVVTKSFERGYCVIAGNPAVIVEDYSQNDIIKSKFLRYRNEHEYNGFIPHAKFEEFRIKNLNV